MSTRYYYLREPITSVRLVEGPRHDKVSVWQDHALAGMLTVTTGSGRQIVSMLSQYDEDAYHCPMYASYGGDAVGCIVRENVRGLDPELTLIDEYGEPFTVAEIRAKAGAGKGAAR